jgi:integrase
VALNDTTIRNLKPAEGRDDVLVADFGGLYIRARRGASGISRTWQFGNKANGRLAIVAIGSYPSVSLKQARAKAAGLALKRAADVPTVGEAAEEWLREVITPTRKSAADIAWYIERACRAIGDTRVDDVTPRHIADTVRNYRDSVSQTKRARSGGRTSAGLMLSALKGAFSYAVARGWIATSPAAPISQAVLGPTSKARTRVLTDAEIEWVMTSNLPAGPVWRFLLCTGLRVSEAFLGRREGRLWIVDASDSKNGVAHRVWLTDLALQQLEARPWPSKSQAQMTLSLIGLGWTCHDLRRTMSTRLNGDGVPPHIVEKLLNHKLKGIQGVYNVATYDDERREALEAWSARLQTRPADVVPMRRDVARG